MCPPSQFHLPRPSPSCPGVQDGWLAGSPCSVQTLLPLDQWQFQSDLLQAGHMLFPGVLELSAEFWLLLMALCGCLESVIPVWLLMMASPTRPSHLFILAAFPFLCSLFREGGNSSSFPASARSTGYSALRKICVQRCSGLCTCRHYHSLFEGKK